MHLSVDFPGFFSYSPLLTCSAFSFRLPPLAVKNWSHHIMHSRFRILLISKELHVNTMWGMCVYHKPKLNSSLRASSPGHSGSLVGKGRRACNYVSGIPEYLHWKNWCEMLIGGDDISTSVMMSLPLACAFQCLLTFALASTLCWLVEIWQLSRQGATGELEVEFKFQRRSCKLSFLFLPRRQSVPRASSQAS